MIKRRGGDDRASEAGVGVYVGSPQRVRRHFDRRAAWKEHDQKEPVSGLASHAEVERDARRLSAEEARPPLAVARLRHAPCALAAPATLELRWPTLEWTSGYGQNAQA